MQVTVQTVIMVIHGLDTFDLLNLVAQDLRDIYTAVYLFRHTIHDVLPVQSWL